MDLFEVNLHNTLTGENVDISIMVLMKNSLLSAETCRAKPLYSLMCSLRDSRCEMYLFDTLSNENTLAAYFTTFPGDFPLLDQLNYISALCLDYELNLLTKVLLRVEHPI